MRGTSNQEYGRFYPSGTKSGQKAETNNSNSQPTYGFNIGHTLPNNLYGQNYHSNFTPGNYYGSTSMEYSDPKSQPQFNVSHPKQKENSVSRAPSISAYSSRSIGLPNLGNTCYMNSVLQCLFNTRNLNSYFANGNNLIDAPNCPLSENFGRLLATAFSKTENIDYLYDALERFKGSVGDINSSFLGYSQHDAHEIFRFILEKMHKELNQARISDETYTEFRLTPSVNSLAKHAEEWRKFSVARDQSKINSIFGGCLLSEVICESCNNKSYSFENTLDLSLDIPKPPSTSSYNKASSVSLAKCLQDFTAEVPVLEYFCSKCNKKRKARRKVTIWKQPEILVIQLKRFVCNKFGHLEALKGDVSFPSDLDLQPFLHKDSKEPKERYKLYGFVNHYGTLDNGHYTAVIHNEGENGWFLYDDEKVSKLTREEVEGFTKGSPNPYLLCYKRNK